MAKYIRNADSVIHTWVGQEIEPGHTFLIQPERYPLWANDSEVLAAITSGIAKMNNGEEDILSPAVAIDFLKGITAPSQRDAENAPIVRMKMAPTGWTYQLRGTEFETSKTGSLLSENGLGVALPDHVIKFYDANGNLLTTQEECDLSCVQTVIDFEPEYPYEIIGGTLRYLENISVDVRLSIIAVPDIPFASGGSKIMVNNCNLRFIPATTGIRADGRVSKRMNPHPLYHTNKLRYILTHPIGHKLKCSVFLEHFKSKGREMNVLFVSSRKIGSKIIQYGTDSHMSHVAVAFKGDPMIYHAYGDSIHKTHEKDFYKAYRVEATILLKANPKEEAEVREGFVNSIFYQGYDWASIFYFAWDRVKGKFFGGKQAKENPLNRDENFICTELVYLLDEYYF